MTNFLSRFLGLHDKKQEQKSEEVADYVHKKKNQFTADMGKVQIQTRKVHKKTLQAQVESDKLVRIVNDIAAQIVRVTPGGKRYGE